MTRRRENPMRPNPARLADATDLEVRSALRALLERAPGGGPRGRLDLWVAIGRQYRLGVRPGRLRKVLDELVAAGEAEFDEQAGVYRRRQHEEAA